MPFIALHNHDVVAHENLSPREHFDFRVLSLRHAISYIPAIKCPFAKSVCTNEFFIRTLLSNVEHYHTVQFTFDELN